MGLRCSLLGHDYGESFVERDREERGNEVVVTERELRECARCGAEKVTTENTEVRTLQQEPDRRDSQSPDTEATTSTQSSADDADDAGGAFTSATDAIEQAEADATTTGSDVEEDDAVIIDSDPDTDAPRSEQWDEPTDTDVDVGANGDVTSPEPTRDLDDEDVEFVESGPSDDAGEPPQSEFEPEPNAAGGTGATQGDAGTASQSAGQTGRAPGEWPEPEGEDEGFDAGPTAETEQTAEFQFGEEDDEEFVAEDTGFTSAGPIDQSDSDDLDFALYCPECGFERYAAGSSLRAGDICPECKRGYLAEDR